MLVRLWIGSGAVEMCEEGDRKGLPRRGDLRSRYAVLACSAGGTFCSLCSSAPSSRIGGEEKGKKWQVLTRIHPLHAIRKCVVRNQIVSSPPGICNDIMGISSCRQQ
jgi:hypothetical protein